MTTKYLDSKRIEGTAEDRAGYPAGVDGVGGWKELGRTTFGGGAKEYSVPSLDNKRYYMILVNNFQSAQTEGDSWKVNSTVGNEYSGRESKNGDVYNGTMINKAKVAFWGFHPHSQPSFAVGWTSNLATKEKLGISYAIGQTANVSGATSPPDRGECVQKWANTSVSINEFMQKNAWNNYNSGSQMVVLGWDPADTHTSNFWEELASVELTSGASNEILSGTFTAKKYLWIQAYIKGDGSTTPNLRVQVNGDTTSNYAERQSTNGATDSTSGNTAQDHFPASSGGKFGNFVNMFVINNASNEKLFMVHGNSIDTLGAGYQPSRREIAGKWANTSDQITSIRIYKTAGGQYQNGSVIKVWGSD